MLLKEFRYVLAVAECGTISKAAQQLYISQPALTKYIHNLEESLNIKLFEKVGRNMKLTSYGYSYVEAGKQILGICDNLEQEAYASDEMIRGTLRVGSGHRGAYVIPSVIPEFSAHFPSVRLEMYEVSYDEVENKLNQGSIDIGILKEPSTLNEPFVTYVPLFQEELVLVTPYNHPLAQFAEYGRTDCSHPWIDLKLFADENFVLYKQRHRNRGLTNKLLLESGIEPKHFFDTDNIEGALHLVQSGYAVCFSPEVYANNILLMDHDKPSIRVFSVGNPVNKYQYCAAYRNNSPLTRYAKEFLRLLEKKYENNLLIEKK